MISLSYILADNTRNKKEVNDTNYTISLLTIQNTKY